MPHFIFLLIPSKMNNYEIKCSEKFNLGPRKSKKKKKNSNKKTTKKHTYQKDVFPHDTAFTVYSLGSLHCLKNLLMELNKSTTYELEFTQFFCGELLRNIYLLHYFCNLT